MGCDQQPIWGSGGGERGRMTRVLTLMMPLRIRRTTTTTTTTTTSSEFAGFELTRRLTDDDDDDGYDEDDETSAKSLEQANDLVVDGLEPKPTEVEFWFRRCPCRKVCSTDRRRRRRRCGCAWREPMKCAHPRRDVEKSNVAMSAASSSSIFSSGDFAPPIEDVSPLPRLARTMILTTARVLRGASSRPRQHVI